MSGSHSADKAEPNMTPILDMVFQLITFFMLVISFKESDFDKNLNLPVVGAATPAEEDTTVEDFVLNLRAGDRLFHGGKEQPNIEGFISIESRRMRSVLEQDGANKEVTVVIRGDKSLKANFMLRVIDACKSAGLQRFDFMVLTGGQS